jgi:hypothetical protein
MVQVRLFHETYYDLGAQVMFNLGGNKSESSFLELPELLDEGRWPAATEIWRAVA